MNLWNDIENSKLSYENNAVKKLEQLNFIKSRQIIIYGYGTIGIGAEKICEICNLPVAAVCDKNKIGLPIKFGIIEDIQSAVKRLKDVVVIVCVRGHYDDIVNEYREIISPKYFIDGDDFYHDTASFFVLDKDSDFFKNKLDKYRQVFISRNKDLDKIMNALEDKKSRDTVTNMFRYMLTCNKDYLFGIYDKNQYFPKDIIHLSDHEVFLDCGAYDGDTSLEFFNLTKKRFGHVYCFEPGKEAFKRLVEMIHESTIKDKVTALPYGVFSSKGEVSFSESGTSSRITESDINVITIQTELIDNLNFKDISFIKMDIEGSELEALKGATQTILKYKPKLAICIYHKPEDFLEIPLYIMSLGLDYKYYIRQHFMGQTETVFYAL
jgi:FkbM family methyltransferase